MYTVRVNNSTTHEIETSGSSFVIDGKDLDWNLVHLSDGHFHILHDNKSYNIELVEVDRDARVFSFKLNGTVYSVILKDRFDLLLEKMGMNATASSKVNSIKAPMPGLIIDLRVKEGQAVRSGDTLLILEAMKMENVIKAPGDGLVRSVKIQKGDSVEKNQILIEF